jgi:enoyl-CoA hydratase/carnithine racemase
MELLQSSQSSAHNARLTVDTTFGTRYDQGMKRWLRFSLCAVAARPRSLRVIKGQVYDAMFQTLAELFERSKQEMLASLQCEDFKEGIAHFIEKRAPVFTGK